ncbi:hypothetical protein GCM10023403_38390 [Pseudonocardia benzenivorans]
MPKPGVRPAAASFSTRSASSPRIPASAAFPSITVAVTAPIVPTHDLPTFAPSRRRAGRPNDGAVR